jgi:hypothetical protein
MKLTRPFCALLGTLALATATLDAQTYTEIGDAGQTLGTAQNTGVTGGQTLNTVFGTIGSAGDADLFRITLTAPTMFSATTTFAGGTTLDTALFLFNSLGQAIYTNDDVSGSSLQSTLPSGTSFTMTLAAGTYFIAISLSGNEPINLSGQLLFAAYINGNSSSIRGAAAGVNPSTLSGFNGATSFPETGAYRIDFTATSTAIPEPSTTAFCLVAAGAAAVVVRRRRKSRSLSA